MGSNIPFQLQEDLEQYFSRELQGKIKAAVSRFLNNRQEELIGLDAFLDEISAQIEPYIDEAISDYGLKCVNFSLAGLDIDTGKYDALDRSHIDALNRETLARGDKAAMDALGGDWGRQKAADILGELARNPGSGSAGAMAAGMGMGMAAGNAFGDMANQLFSQADKAAQPTISSSQEDPVEVLSKLKKLLDAGLIEQDEYDEKKKEVLSRM